VPPKPPGLTYRWYKKDKFRTLPEDHQEWLCYEKRRRDKESTAALKKGNKRKVKTLIRKEKRKLAKLKASNKEGKKADERDNSGNESN
jgi:hypothetical protein